jgi:hypothetical protein
MTLFEKLWRLLPDRCQVPDCKRQGVRGNENIVEGFLVCDECQVTNFGDRGGAPLRIGGWHSVKGYDIDALFDAIKRHDELLMRSREVFLDAMEAQYKSANIEDKAIVAAIHAEREAIAAARKSA